MKCPSCNKGEMKKVKGIIEEDGIEYEGFRCNQCNEEIMNMSQLKILATKYRKLQRGKQITFQKWGNSFAIRIPDDIVKEFSIKPGAIGILTRDKLGIKIIPS